MKLTLFGATGMIGSRILTEALNRGHRVTAVVRDPAKLAVSHPNLVKVQGEVTVCAPVAAAVLGSDAVISALSPGHGDPYAIKQLTATLLDGVRWAKVKRVVVVGGAGSLHIADGTRVVDLPSFPAAWKDIALAHCDVLEALRPCTELDWTYFSPPALIQPGERTGKYRTGTEQLVADAKGDSRISCEDFAVALLDELEKPQFIQKRFTAAY